MNFSANSCINCLISWKSTKTHRFGQNYATFSNKLPCFGVSMNLSAKGCKKCLNSWKSTKNHGFGQNFATFRTNYHVFAFRSTFQEKIAKSASFPEKARKTIDLAKTSNFSSKLRCLGIFMNFSKRSCRKCHISWKTTRNHRFRPNLQLFEQTTMFFRFDELYRKKLQKLLHFVKKHEKSSIWQKLRNFFEQTTMFWCFDELFSKRLQKVAQFVKKDEISSIWPKLCNFRTTTMSLDFDELLRKKSQEVPHFVKKHEKSSIWPHLYNFSKKLPCLWISMKFSRKSSKKCLISLKSTQKSPIWQNLYNFSNRLPCLWIAMNFSGKSSRNCLISLKSTKNHRSGQVFITYRTNYHVFAFRWTFKEKVAKSASLREKARQIIDFANTMQLFEQTTMLLHFDELLRKRLERVVHFVKKHEKSWIWSKLATFRTNYHVLVFRWTFRQTVAETASFRERERKLIHLAEPMQLFRTNYHVLVFRWTFQQKVAKSGSIREKARKVMDLAKTLQLFEQTPMSWHFDELFRKKLQKVPHFVKNHEKSSTSPKLATFRTNYHVFSVRWTLWQKVAKTASFREKARKVIDLAKNMQLFRTNYHVLVFRWTFQQKVAKSGSIREKARKIIDLAKTLQLFEQLPCLCISINFSRKSCKKFLISRKARKIIDLAKSL